MSFSERMRSFSPAIMRKMGATNQHWGVCGFTSSFYAIYAQNPAKRPLLLRAGIATKVLAEIKTYLMILKADGHVALLNEIEDFTRSFGKVNKTDFSDFTIDEYIKLINKAPGKSEEELTGNPRYSIGMPPQAVADYLNRIWGCNSTVQFIMGGEGGTDDAIIGVSSPTKPHMTRYNGLCHYLYRHQNQYHSWGQMPKSSLAQFTQNYRACLAIKFEL